MRITELEELIRYHSDLYYNESAPEIPDSEFDALVDELRSLDKDNSVLAEVGASPSYGKKVKHSSLMGSLNKVNDYDGLNKWYKQYAEKTGLFIAPKVDGLAVRLNYENGHLTEAATRGDGEIGMDVTDNIKATASIPNEIPGFTGEFRGEIYMKKSVWEELGGEAFAANPRNAASGALLNKDPSITEERKLNFLAYDLINGLFAPTEQDKKKHAQNLASGIEFVSYALFGKAGSKTLDKSIQDEILDDWEYKQRPALDYEIDGLVISIDLIALQEQAGWTGRKPKGKIAYKFKPEQSEAEVLDIDNQVGRTGKLTPMARISPTRLQGSTVSNVTLHNWARVKELGIGIGAKVVVEKAGDIIPQVVSVSQTPPVQAEEPKECPSCTGEVELDERGISFWCNNETCPARLEERVIHYIKSIGVMGVGSAIVVGLNQAGLIRDIPDLYYLKQVDVQKVTGGKRSAEKAINAIMDMYDIPLAKFLDGLGIHGLGTTTGKLIAKEFKTIEAVREATYADFVALDGIGHKFAESIQDGLQRLSDTIDRLLKVIDVEEVEEASGSLAGKSFCLTGAMSRGRKDISAEIESAGGEIKSSVGKGLTYLVQADPSSESSKTKKAAKNGTEVISEESLMEMMT